MDSLQSWRLVDMWVFAIAGCFVRAVVRMQACACLCVCVDTRHCVCDGNPKVVTRYPFGQQITITFEINDLEQ